MGHLEGNFTPVLYTGRKVTFCRPFTLIHSEVSVSGVERLKSLQSKLCVRVKRVEVGVVMKGSRVHRTAKANGARGRPLNL